VWVHGGAWVGGDLDMPEAHAVAPRLAARLSAVVVSVDYRLAPAHPYPAALDDVVAAFEWLGRLPGVEPGRLALGGASAGGNLAAGAAQNLRDRGGVQPDACVLAYPATDPLGGPYEGARPAVCPPLLWFDRALTSLAFEVYLAGADAVAPAVPAAGDLRGLPPTLITTSALDALEPQAVRFGELLAAAGTEVTHHRVDGVLHEYLDLCGDVAVADDALRRHGDWLAARLA
jgi:acetyl esterase